VGVVVVVVVVAVVEEEEEEEEGEEGEQEEEKMEAAAGPDDTNNSRGGGVEAVGGAVAAAAAEVEVIDEAVERERLAIGRARYLVKYKAIKRRMRREQKTRRDQAQLVRIACFAYLMALWLISRISE
jgi:hypothetical protein